MAEQSNYHAGKVAWQWAASTKSHPVVAHSSAQGLIVAEGKPIGPSLELGTQTSEDCDGRRRAVALGQAGARRLRDEYRAGWGEGTEGVIVSVGDVLGPGEEFQVGQYLVARAGAQGDVARQRRDEICLVAEEVLATRGQQRGADCPFVGHVVVGAGLELMQGDAGQVV